MTTPCDAIGLSERLREHARFGIVSIEPTSILSLLDEAATQLDALSARVKDCEEVLADKRRLAREIDIALHGEEGASKQASLCDLVEPAIRLRAIVKELEAENKRLLKYMVPISKDGNHVFIDGTGDVEIDHEGALRSRATRAEQERDEAYERAAKVINETITGVAILTEDGAFWALPKPHRHHHIFALAALTGKLADPGIQGFTTSFARFVNRKEALSLAVASKQIIDRQRDSNLNELYSEDLW